MRWYLPGSLIFAVSSLYNLMLPRQYFLLEDLCAASLIHTCYFEDLGRVDIGVPTSPHNGDASDHAFIDLTRGVRMNALSAKIDTTWTEEYTALYILTGGWVFPGALGPACIGKEDEDVVGCNVM